MKPLTARRLEQAVRSIEAARRDLEAGRPELGASRAYCAMFYVAEALLVERDLGYSKHGQVHGAFGRKFAKTGELDSKFHAWMLLAFEKRLAADYGEEEFAGSQEDVEIMIGQAEEFLAAARIYLEKRP